MVIRDIKFIIRSLFNDRLFLIIAVLSISVGVAASALIAQYVIHEWRYDTFHANKDQIYRVLSWNSRNGIETSYPGFSSRLAPELKNSTMGVANFTRIYRSNTAIIKNPENPDLIGEEEGFMFADSSFFSMFSFHLVNSLEKSSLARPNTVVISQKMAAKYFGDSNPLGKFLSYNGDHLLEVVAISENPPSNSTITFGFVSSIETLHKLDSFTYENLPNFETFVQIPDSNKVNQTAESIKPVNQLIGALNFAASDRYRLEPLLSLRSGKTFTYNDKSVVATIPIFLIIGCGILLLSILNFVNLTASRSSIRLPEMMLRMRLGANRFAIFRQYFLQTLIITGSGFLIGLGMALLFRERFNELLNINIGTDFLKDPIFVTGVLLIFLFSVAASSIHPAVLAGSVRYSAHDSSGTISKSTAWGKQALMLTQFSISICLIISSILISKQIRKFVDFDPGFDKNEVIDIVLGPNASQKSQSIKEEIARIPGVNKISMSNTGLFRSYAAAPFKTRSNQIGTSLIMLQVDSDFIDNFSLKWKVEPGANAPVNPSGDVLVLSRAACTSLGLDVDDAVGKEILWQEGAPYGRVGGVVEDFNIVGAKKLASPVIMLVKNRPGREDGYKHLQIRFAGKERIEKKIEQIQAVFRKFEAQRPFKYSFVSDDFQNLFSSDTRFSKLVWIFTYIANFLSCIGLFGLSTYIINARDKEISIRKTLGASAFDIFLLLYRRFFFLILAAIFIASPFAYWFIMDWTESLAYKSPINVESFLISAFIALSIAFVTIIFQGIRASTAEPIKSLRRTGN